MKLHNLESSSTNEVMFPVPEKTLCISFARETRKNLDVLNDETLLMGLSWTLPKEKLCLNMFPEVIFVDVIVDVNKDKRPLLTVTGKDANAKMFKFLRAFLPNKKQWAFWWIFSNVFPRSFPPSILGRVGLIISDGCVQENSQIDNAISLCFLNATQIRCGFHTITMGWKNRVLPKKHIPPDGSKNKEHIFYNTVCRHLQIWMYYWMTKACTNKQ